MKNDQHGPAAHAVAKVDRVRLAGLIARWLLLRILFAVWIKRDSYPYNPFRPAEKGGGGSGSMATPDQALAFMEQQKSSGSTAWYNLCEKLCRSSYRLNGMYDSAEKHSKNIPSNFRHGQEYPSKGDLIMYENGGYGHIVVATGNGWECWSNDYSGRGKVNKCDARDLVSWCGAYKWFVADAWWSNTYYQETHGSASTPAPIPPSTDEDDMDYAEVKTKDAGVSVGTNWSYLDLPLEVRDSAGLHYDGPTWSLAGRRFQFTIGTSIKTDDAIITVQAAMLNGETVKSTTPQMSGGAPEQSPGFVLAGYCPSDQRVRIRVKATKNTTLNAYVTCFAWK